MVNIKIFANVQAVACVVCDDSKLRLDYHRGIQHASAIDQYSYCVHVNSVTVKSAKIKHTCTWSIFDLIVGLLKVVYVTV